MRAFVFALLAACVCAAPHVAHGQPVALAQQTRPRALPPPPPPGTSRPAPRTQVPTPRAAARRAPQWRGLLAAGALWQPGTTSFTDRRSDTVFRETAITTGEYDIDGAVGLDVGGIVRVWRDLGLGLAVTSLSRPGAAAYALSSPHPFFFGRPRTADVDASGLDRTETGIHLSAAYHLGAPSAWRLTLYGGPSVYAIRQTVLDDLSIADAYPYDAITAAPGRSSDRSESAIGFHVGGDVTWYFSRRLGAGALVRYASASANTSLGGGEDVGLDAGGLQVGLGLRLRF